MGHPHPPDIMRLARNDWSFEADLSNMPHYAVLTWSGSPSRQRALMSKAFVEDEVVPRLVVDDEGTFAPLLIDLSEDKPSVIVLQTGLALIRQYRSNFSRIVMVLNSASRVQSMMQIFWEMWAAAAPSGVVSVADSVEEAQTMLTEPSI